MKNVAIFVALVLVSASSGWYPSKSTAKSPAPVIDKVAARSSDKGAESVDRDKRINAMMKSTLRSFSSANLTEEQQQQADALFGKAIKSLVTRRAEAMITEELQKKYAACLKQARASSAKEQASEAFACAGFTEEQIKVFESTQKVLDKAKRDFHKTLTDSQIAGLPKTLQKSIQGDKR